MQSEKCHKNQEIDNKENFKNKGAMSSVKKSRKDMYNED